MGRGKEIVREGRMNSCGVYSWGIGYGERMRKMCEEDEIQRVTEEKMRDYQL